MYILDLLKEIFSRRPNNEDYDEDDCDCPECRGEEREADFYLHCPAPLAIIRLNPISFARQVFGAAGIDSFSFSLSRDTDVVNIFCNTQMRPGNMISLAKSFSLSLVDVYDTLNDANINPADTGPIVLSPNLGDHLNKFFCQTCKIYSEGGNLTRLLDRRNNQRDETENLT